MKNAASTLALLATLGLSLSGCERSQEADPSGPEPESARLMLNDFELVPRDTYFGNPERTQARISPDGALMSFRAPVDGVMNVWVAPLGDFDAARPITEDTGSGIDSHQWASNSKNILYIRDTGGDEDFHIYSVDLETGDTIDLTPFEKTTGQFVAASYDYPDDYLIGMNNRDARWHDVWRVNVRTGDRVLIEENDGFRRYIADLDLNIRLASSPTADGGFMLHKRGPDGEWVEFIKVDKDDSFNTEIIAFTESGDEFLMRSSEGRDKSAILLVDYQSGDSTVVAESDAADVGATILDPQTNELLAYSVMHLKKHWFGLSDALEQDLAQIQEVLTGEVTLYGQTQDGNMWVLGNVAPKESLAYYVYDRLNGTVDKLFTARPALDDVPLNDMHALSLQSRDGLELVSYLTLPPHADADGDGRPADPVPLVLDVHGGPWSRNIYGFNPIAQWLSNRGFAVLQVNFRGSTGFGKSFVNAGNMQWGEKMHDDLLDAVDWAISEGITTPDKVAIIGASYGGYATLAGLAFTPEVFACGVDVVGLSNLITVLNSIPPYWESIIENYTRRMGDHRTEEGRAYLRSVSPLFKADQITKPLLIGQGANDPRVRQAESDQIVAAMQENNLPVTYLLYPDEGHGFSRPENRESFYAVMEVFLDDCLGGRSQGLDGALSGSSTTVPAGAEHVPGLAEALEGFEPVIRN